MAVRNAAQIVKRAPVPYRDRKPAPYPAGVFSGYRAMLAFFSHESFPFQAEAGHNARPLSKELMK
jgi:hypothetical protein